MEEGAEPRRRRKRRRRRRRRREWVPSGIPAFPRASELGCASCLEKNV